MSHEMKTPLLTTVFFLKRIIEIIQSAKVFHLDNPIHKYCKMMLCQLEYLQTFIDNLLFLKQMRDGVFNAENIAFDPNAVLNQICEVYQA